MNIDISIHANIIFRTFLDTRNYLPLHSPFLIDWHLFHLLHCDRINHPMVDYFWNRVPLLRSDQKGHQLVLQVNSLGDDHPLRKSKLFGVPQGISWVFSSLPGEVEAGACSKEPDGHEQVLGGSGLKLGGS